MTSTVSWPALTVGDAVALVSPGSWSERNDLELTVALLESWGLVVRVGTHADDRWGYMAGRDEHRVQDINDALQDSRIRAVIAARGGCGSLRLLHGVDADALRADPKPLLGFSDVTALHHVWHRAGVPSLHGGLYGEHVERTRSQLFGGPLGIVQADATAFGADLTLPGTAEGPVFGGNLEMLARSVGVLDPDLEDHILLLEILRNDGLGMVDRALTQLMLSGTLDGIVGVALGGLTGYEEFVDRDWTVIDLLRERFAALQVPVLAGLPVGHLEDPVTVPLGVQCRLDSGAGTLTSLG